MFEESETARSAAGPDIEDFDKEKQNFENYDVTTMTEQNLMLCDSEIEQTTNPEHQKASEPFANYEAKSCK